MPGQLNIILLYFPGSILLYFPGSAVQTNKRVSKQTHYVEIREAEISLNLF